MKVSTAIRLESIKEYYFSKKLREVADLIQAGKPILNMGIGSPDLPPHPSVTEALHGARVWRNRLIMHRELKEMSQSKADEVSMTNVPAAEENVSAASASSTTLTPTTVVQFRRHTGGGTVPTTAGDSSSDESWTPLESLG